MTGRSDKEWEADLDPFDVGRPGSYAASRALAQIDADAEKKHWQERYREEPYCRPDHEFDHYALAYQVGYEGAARHAGERFSAVEQQLATEYERHSTAESPPWDDVRDAAQAAWDRVNATRAR